MDALTSSTERWLFQRTSPPMCENGCISHDCLLLHADGACGNGIRGVLATGFPLLFTSMPGTTNVSAEAPNLHPYH